MSRSAFLAPPTARRIMWILIAGVGVWHGIMMLDIALWSFWYPFELHQWGEWDMLQHTWLLATGQPVYPTGTWGQAPSMPYTPLYMSLMAIPVRLLGPHLSIGRAASLLFYAITLGLLYRWARKRSLPGRWAGGAVLLGVMVQAVSGYSLQKFHPNALTILLGMLALYLVGQRARPGLTRWSAAFFLALMAFFSKQPGAVFFAAVLISAWFRSRRLAIAGGAITLAAGGAIWMLLHRLTDGGFGFYCFELPRAFPLEWHRLDDGARHLLQNAWFFLLPASVVILRTRQPWKDPLLLGCGLALCSSLFSFAMAGGTASNFAYALIPLALVAAQGWYHMANSRIARRGTAIPVAIGLAFAAQILLPRTSWPRPDKSDLHAAEQLVRVMRRQEGPVLALVNTHQQFLAGKGWQTTADGMWELAHAGITRYPALERDVKNRVYSLVAISEWKLSGNDSFDTLPLHSLLHSHYERDTTIVSSYLHSPVVLLRPRGGR